MKVNLRFAIAGMDQNDGRRRGCIGWWSFLHDPLGRELTYSWSIASQPQASSATIF